MITMKEWMELVDYKITEGSDYGWECYGPNAYTLDSWNGVHGVGGYSFSIVFSTKTQKVYEVSMCDYTNDRAYRMINPKNQEKHRKEAEHKSVLANQAWDDVDYVDLDVLDDFIQKALAIKAGEDYSTDVSIPLDLPDDLLLEAALNAHRQNITLNEYINNALREMLAEFERDPEGAKARAALWKANAQETSPL
jgi:ribosomal protein S18